MTLDDTTTEVNPDALAATLHSPRREAWSPVTITMHERSSFESLHLWLASQARPFGTLAADREHAAGLVDPQDRFVCPTLLTTDSLAYLAMRKLEDTTWQFGTHGFGPDADTLTTDMLKPHHDLGTPPPARTRSDNHRAPHRHPPAHTRRTPAARYPPPRHDHRHLAHLGGATMTRDASRTERFSPGSIGRVGYQKVRNAAAIDGRWDDRGTSDASTFASRPADSARPQDRVDDRRIDPSPAPSQGSRLAGMRRRSTQALDEQEVSLGAPGAGAPRECSVDRRRLDHRRGELWLRGRGEGL
ncbi:hypothetical protein [Micromonospora sp. C95]|uniref:hypothetical protein n=1 Tax=Micromonospora sp. C95 TaxID=2824882 RepID=UPI001B399E1B|nr:hypothetical protein [Micromonospora sp. C95]MBQ1023951.1 hypothetical protein [Micromonospora sp. C95]